MDIVNPQGANSSRETNALAGLFAPVRAQDPDNRENAGETIETRSLASPSYSEGVVSMESQTGDESHVASRSSSLTSDGYVTYTSQEL